MGWCQLKMRTRTNFTSSFHQLRLQWSIRSKRSRMVLSITSFWRSLLILFIPPLVYWLKRESAFCNHPQKRNSWSSQSVFSLFGINAIIPCFFVVRRTLFQTFCHCSNYLISAQRKLCLLTSWFPQSHFFYNNKQSQSFNLSHFFNLKDQHYHLMLSVCVQASVLSKQSKNITVPFDFPATLIFLSFKTKSKSNDFSINVSFLAMINKLIFNFVWPTKSKIENREFPFCHSYRKYRYFDSDKAQLNGTIKKERKKVI